MLIGKIETGNFTVFSVIRTMFIIQICKIINQTQTFNFDNSPKKDIQIHPILKFYPNVVRAMQIFTTRKNSFLNVAHSKYMTAINRTFNNCHPISLIAKFRYNQNFKKIYQMSVSNENFEFGKHDVFIDFIFYNVHNEVFNENYDKYDDYQNYGGEISDNMIKGIDINFINLSTPSVKFKSKHTCDRYR